MVIKSSFVRKISFARSSSIDSTSQPLHATPEPTVASLLEQIVSLDDTPFLVSQRKIPPLGLLRLDRSSIRLGNVLRKGEFTRTHEIRACRPLAAMDALAAALEAKEEEEGSENSNEEEEEGKEPVPRRKNGVIRRTGRAIRFSLGTPDASKEAPQQQYTIKLLTGQGSGGDRGSNNGEERSIDFKVQTQHKTQLLKEALYLSVLDHPGIVRLRAFPVLNSPQVFVVTDRIAETLEDRITVWRRARRRARELEQEERKDRRIFGKRQPRMTLFEDEVLAMVQKDLVALKTNYALQIAEAMKYLHDRGIVIRELRPDTIGFMEYPHHHQVLLCDLSHAKELPLDEPLLLPSTEPLILTPEEENDQFTMDPSEMSTSFFPSNSVLFGIEESQQQRSYPSSNVLSFRRANSAPAQVERREVTTETPGSGSASSGMSDLSNMHSPPTREIPSMDESARSTASSRSRTPSSAAARNCYRAPEMYAVCCTGYNTKVDCYSWAMIYYELLADKRPTRRCDAETIDQLYEQIRNHRPSLYNCHFPLSTQQIIRQAWESDLSRRYSSEQLTRNLHRVLLVLEGKRLDGRNRNGLKSKYRSLPERAARVVSSQAAKGWSDIRKPLSMRRQPTC